MNFNNQSFLDTYNSKEEEFDIVSLTRLVQESYGENDDLDFKEKVIEEHKVAKLLIAMANSGGGSIIFGISDDRKPIGLNTDELKDETDFSRKLRSYLPSNLEYEYRYLNYPDEDVYGDFKGKTFLILYTKEQNRYVPFLPAKEAPSMKRNDIYLRKNASVETATNDDLENMFKLRLVEQYEDLTELELEEHLEQLKLLYSSIQRSYIQIPALTGFSRELRGALKGIQSAKNKDYPEEEYEEFISKMIKKKKKRIEQILEVSNIED